MNKAVVTPEAKEYILQKGGAVTVRVIKGQGGCCSMFSPVIELGRPGDAAGYQLFHGDGVDVFVQEGLNVLPEGVRVSLNRLWWMKKVDVHGLEILP